MIKTYEEHIHHDGDKSSIEKFLADNKLSVDDFLSHVYGKTFNHNTDSLDAGLRNFESFIAKHKLSIEDLKTYEDEHGHTVFSIVDGMDFQQAKDDLGTKDDKSVVEFTLSCRIMFKYDIQD